MVPPTTAPAPWSARATSRRALELLDALDWSSARVADVGAGRGHFSNELAAGLAARGLDPARHVFACDLRPESFECRTVSCSPVAPDGRLPFPDDHFDATVSIEVIEHVEDQFGFLRELARVTKPGGFVVVTTPNVLNINSRLRAFTTGFPLLYDPLRLDSHDPRLLGGHIHPISPYYLAYAALRAGLVRPTFHPDRTKRSAVALAALFAPAILFGRALFRARMRRKLPTELAQNRAVLEATQGFALLTCRTAVLRAEKPAT